MTDFHAAAPIDVSILIATRDRATSLACTLKMIAAQELAGLSMEVVVVDNGSSDNTRDVLQAAAKTMPLVTLLEPVPGKNTALNRAIKEATGQLFIFTDDDTVPAAGWVSTLYEAACRWPEDNVFGGTSKPKYPPDSPGWLTEPTFPYGRWTAGLYAPRSDEGPTADTPLGTNLAIRRTVFTDIQFDETMGPRGTDYPMGSEVDLLMRLYRRGEQFIFVPSAVVEHVLQDYMVDPHFLKGRAFRCGRGNARLFPETGSFPLFGIPLHVVKRAIAAYFGVAGALFQQEGSRRIASLTLHQVRGNMAERRRVQAQEHTGTRQFPTRDTFRLLIKRRGVPGTVLTPIKWILSPLIEYDVYQFFECDLKKEQSLIPAVEGVEVRVLRGAEHSRNVRVALCPLEVLNPQEVDDRLSRGHSVAIAWANGQAVAFAWSAYSDLNFTEIGTTIRVGPQDIVGYDGYTVEAWRGRGILPLLDQAQINAAITVGRTRQLIYSSTRNRSTARVMKRMRKRRVFKIAYVRIPITGWETRRTFGEPFSRYFKPHFSVG